VSFGLNSMKRIVLAYSGDLETSVAIPWLAGHPSIEIVAVVIDLGRRSDLVELRERALSLGAVRCHVVDAREEFGRDYILPALQAGAFLDVGSPLISALAKPIVARKLTELARMEGAGAVAYGAGTAQDRTPLDVLTRAINPSLDVIVPARTWGMSHAEVVAYAQSRDIQIPALTGGLQKLSSNLWGRSVVFDALQDSWAEAPEETFALTRAPKDAPDQPAYVEVELRKGVPASVNGIEMALLEMIESLEIIAGTHGVGRTDSIVTTTNGKRMREIGEAPAAVILQTVHRELEALVVSRELVRLIGELGRAYNDVIQSGNWFSLTRQALDAFTASIQPEVSGSVRLELFKGQFRVAGRKATSGPEDRSQPSRVGSTGHGHPAQPVIK
jgi:argininosuccinate synthase